MRKDATNPSTSSHLKDTVVRPDPATRPRVVARNNEPTREKKGPPLGEILMELGFADADSVLDGLSTQLGVPPTRVNSFTFTAEALSHLSERIARKYTAIPMLKVGGTLVVATANPRDLQALDDLRFAAGFEISTMICCRHWRLRSLLD